MLLSAVFVQPGMGGAEDLRGTVRDDAGQPVKGAEVFLLRLGQHAIVQEGRLQKVSPAGTPSWAARTDGAGAFVFSELAAGSIAWLGVVHSQGQALLREPDPASRQPITLQPWARIHGQAQRGREPHADVTLTAEVCDQFKGAGDSLGAAVIWRSEAITNEAGRFSLAHLPPGEVVVSRHFAAPRGGTWMDRSVFLSLTAGQTLAGVQIGGVGRPVVGRLSWREEEPAWTEAHAVISEVRKAQDESSSAPGAPAPARRFLGRVEKDGVFRAEDIPEGTYHLSVMLGTGVADEWSAHRRWAGMVDQRIAVPPVPGGWSAEAMDLGDLRVRRTNEFDERAGGFPSQGTTDFAPQ